MEDTIGLLGRRSDWDTTAKEVVTDFRELDAYMCYRGICMDLCQSIEP